MHNMFLGMDLERLQKFVLVYESMLLTFTGDYNLCYCLSDLVS